MAQHNDRPSFSDALRHHWHEWHDRNWWHGHCDTIVFVNTGYYFLDGSYWYPAWGYDPLQSSYDYDGPIYTYGDLLPDEVIANVQTVLQDAGYYFGAVTGSLNFETRTALANFQRDYGLEISGAIDEPTVETLGLGQSEVYQIWRRVEFKLLAPHARVSKCLPRRSSTEAGEPRSDTFDSALRTGRLPIAIRNRPAKA